MAKIENGDGLSGPFAARARSLRKMTPAQFKRLLLKVGIIDKNGELTPKYRSAKRR